MSQEKNDFDILDFAAQVSKFIEKNFKAFLAVVVALIVGGVVWNLMSQQAKQKEKAAFDKLFAITKIYEKKKEGFDEAKAEAEKKPSKKDDKTAEADEPKKDLTPATGDINNDYGEVVQQLEAYINENLGKNASGEAALILSEIYGDYKMPEKGAEALGKVLGQWSDRNVLYFVMQMRAGDLWASADNCEKAVSYWQVVANGESFITNQAQLKLGVCLQTIGRVDEARKWFKKIQDKDPNSAEGFSAKRYLRFLEFKTKTGEETSDDKAQNQKKTEDKKS